MDGKESPSEYGVTKRLGEKTLKVMVLRCYVLGESISEVGKDWKEKDNGQVQ